MKKPQQSNSEMIINQSRIIVPTSNLDRIRKTTRYSIENNCLSMLIGQNGYGKTAGLKYMQELYPRSVYFRVGVGEPARVFYARFLSQLEGNSSINPDYLAKDKYLFYLMDKASFIINSRKEDIDLIIIDEFGNFNSKYVSYIRQVWDDIQPNIGMILAGPPSILQDLKKWQRLKKKGINELLSRVGSRLVHLEKHSLEDSELICNSREIYEQEEVNFFHRNSTDLRILHSLIDDLKTGNLEIE